MRSITATVLVASAMLAACEAQQQEAPMVPVAQLGTTPVERPRLAFHSQIDWQFQQVPLPAGRCTEPLPPGLSYLWLTYLTGTAVSTHLGKGTFEGSICIYGQLTDPTTEPPGNGIPVGWRNGSVVFTAANGDQLLATIWSTGFTSPPGTPGWQFTEQGMFVDGGTGRFEHAEGAFTGLIDPVAFKAVYEGWIRFGKED